MSRSDIDAALRQSFISGNFGLPVAFENFAAVDPDTGIPVNPGGGELNSSPWCRVTIIHALPVIETMGTEGLDAIAVIMQVDLFYPRDTGTAAANAKADDIVETFPAGSTHNYNGIAVHVTASGRVSASDEPEYYRLTVQINSNCWHGR